MTDNQCLNYTVFTLFRAEQEESSLEIKHLVTTLDIVHNVYIYTFDLNIL